MVHDHTLQERAEDIGCSGSSEVVVDPQVETQTISKLHYPVKPGMLHPSVIVVLNRHYDVPPECDEKTETVKEHDSRVFDSSITMKRKFLFQGADALTHYNNLNARPEFYDRPVSFSVAFNDWCNSKNPDLPGLFRYKFSRGLERITQACSMNCGNCCKSKVGFPKDLMKRDSERSFRDPEDKSCRVLVCPIYSVRDIYTLLAPDDYWV